MAEIDILIAAYNGERFIAEQIESLLSQTFQDIRILIRDDGSSDNTPAIIESYAQKYPGKVEVVHDDAVCRSPAKNFMELVQHAEADYVMFCDQDDVWLPYKVQVMLWHMKETERRHPGVPVLVFAGMEVVDAELNSLGKIEQIYIPKQICTFKETPFSNCAPGCAQMMNRLVYQGLGVYEDGIIMHDWWSVLYASAFGVIEHVPSVLMLYRQHENNFLGANVKKYKHVIGVKKIIHEFMSRPMGTFLRLRDRYMAKKKQIDLFVSRYYSQLSPERQKQIDVYIELFGRSRLKRFMTAWQLDCTFK